MNSDAGGRHAPVRGTRSGVLAGRSSRAKRSEQASFRRVPPAAVRAFRSEVLTYWKRSGRDHLPWRKTRDPWRILVSEMMLQQTQVDRVIPFYERFVARFPKPGACAEAPLSEVLRLWNGLGYNRRAKYLHDAARRWPVLSSRGRAEIAYDGLRKLPGVGDYTAKAIRVFAWNQPEVLIETNVRAVFIHHFFPRCREVHDARILPLVSASLTMLPRGLGPREWYAALMDYGTFLKATRPNPSRRSKHHVRQPKFEGSLRQVRGAILRAHLAGTPLTSVRRTHEDRYAEAYRSLVRDGLIPG